MDRADNMIKATALRARTLAIERREKFDMVLDETENRLWLRRNADKDKPFQQAVWDEPQTLGGPIRLLLGSFGSSVTFAPSGGLTSGTNLAGFHFLGVTAYEGQVESADAGSLTVLGTPWQADATVYPDGKYKGYYVAITRPSTVQGQVRLITSNTSNSSPPSSTLTLQSNWKDDVAPQKGDKFGIVAPNNIRKVVIYSTTGQVVSSAP
jgi:hypothetical protein